MTAPQNPRVTQADDPERIYLQPQGCFDPQGYDGRLWCEDPIWPDECGCDCPCPKAAVSYVREDIAKAAEAASKAREAALVEALGWFVGGDCPACKGWGEVAYFGEMVACKCNGQYLPTPSHEQVRRARIALAALGSDRNE